MARQGYGNASFEVGGDEGLDIVEEFYNDQQNAVDAPPESVSVHQVMEDAAGIKLGLRQIVRAVN